MATLTPIVPGDAVGAGLSGVGWDSAPNGALGDNSDATFGAVSTNASGTYDHLWELGNVDADLGNMDTLAIVLRYRWTASVSNSTWNTLAARVIAADGTTVLAAGNGGGTHQTVASTITTTTITNSGSTAFTYVNTTATKAQWDGARLEVRIVRTRAKGGDASSQAIYEADLTGTYTAAVAPEEHSGTLAATGGGVATSSGRKGALVAATSTGGGTAALQTESGRLGTVAATGAGVATTGATTTRSAPLTATGAGVATLVGEADEPSVDADGVLTATGGGVATLEASTQRTTAIAATGAGAATLVATSARQGTLQATGSGSASLSATAARFGAMLLSGGGVLTSVGTTARSSAITATGGGSATLNGTAETPPEEYTGTLTATGGGAYTTAGTTARQNVIAATGAGELSMTAITARLAELRATGGGSWGHSATSARQGVMAATGGGSATLFAGDPPVGLPDGFTVQVSLLPVLGTDVDAGGTGVAVGLAPVPSVEVTLT